MSPRKNLYLVDSQTKRRAAVCHALAQSKIYVEPFETIEEVQAHWPREGVVLVEDAPGRIPALLEYMAQSARWLPLIGFSENPGAQQVAQAVLDGALGYLAWPCAPERSRRRSPMRRTMPSASAASASARPAPAARSGS